ncbi:hypothetical protein POTOM_030883 [Populus tomentosa]|uniref:Vacuolar protein-sorting-associated protein 36 n=1 Tax=Populus tomentosa TaxID=118781 RepID=A0A8X7Z6G9_POPTO|nr:hypothetical protein POTOM_030883 [Populus tomentosa]
MWMVKFGKGGIRACKRLFQDLNALMAVALVRLSEKVRQRLLPGSSSQSSYGDDEEMDSKEEMKDWLLSVGIISPVTKESAEYYFNPYRTFDSLAALTDANRPFILFVRVLHRVDLACGLVASKFSLGEVRCVCMILSY